MARNQIAQAHLLAAFAGAEPSLLEFRTYFAGALKRFRVELVTAPVGGAAVFKLYHTPAAGGGESVVATLTLTAGSNAGELTSSLGSCADGDLYRVALDSTVSLIGNPITVMVEAAETDAEKADSYLLDRGHHSGSQTASTISDFATAVHAAMSRQTVTYTSASLADGAVEVGTVAMGKTCVLLKCETDHPAWVELYETAAARTADAGRLVTVDPSPGAGVLFDALTAAGGLVITCSPPPTLVNGDTPASSNLYLRLTNKSGATNVINLTLTFIILEN